MTWLWPGTMSEWLRLLLYIYFIDHMPTRFFRALWYPQAHYFRVPICAICQNDPFWSFWFLCAHCPGLIFFQFANRQNKKISFSALKKCIHKFANWDPNTMSMRAVGSCVFSPLAHLFHPAWPISEQWFEYIAMHALGSPTRVSLLVFCAHCRLSIYQCAHLYSGYYRNMLFCALSIALGVIARNVIHHVHIGSSNAGYPS